MNERAHLGIISVAHSYADMGTIRDEIHVDEQYEAAVTRYWAGIFRYLMSFSSKFLASLQIYQDGLAIAPQQVVDRIVDETQTANYEILRWLKEKGATVFGTEDAGLLREEHRALQTIVNYPDGEIKNAARLEYLKKSTWLSEERDEFIGRRIEDTLPKGRTGLLFIGVAHDVGSHLSNKIRVSKPKIVTDMLPSVLRTFYGLGEERKVPFNK